MPLHLAEVLRPGNHLLAGVAALVEADAADLFEIGHLRHEFFLGGQRDERIGGLDVEPAPDGTAGRPGLDGQLLPQRRHSGLGDDDNETGGVESDDRRVALACGGHRIARAGQAGIGQRFVGLRAGQAEHERAVGQGGQLDLGAQDEHLQAFLAGFLEVGRECQQVAVVLAPDQKAGLHAALGRAPAGMLRLLLAEVIDVAGELAVQEGLGVFAGGLDQGEMGQRDDDGLRACRLQFGGGIAKVEKFGRFAVELSFGGFEKAAPVGIHGGSRRGFGYYIARFNVLVPHGQDLLAADEFPCAY